ncbi:MFS transporter [Glycomyces tenuis]|uniref:MFS transporter n=1 Tax=Glycomyces tenuis TaxID=58116 RepID=UPI000414F6B9|nr:MFS transporter [Glycomyces tenuis]
MIARTAERKFSGPRMVVIATLAMGLTAPGQTASISVFIDPMIADLGLGRTAVSGAYMIGTLAGAFALPWVGRAVDRYGVRRVMSVVVVAFGSACVGLSFAQNLVGLAFGFIGVRMLGQGALGLCAATLVARWYAKRRGRVLSVQIAVGGGIIALSPVPLERIIAASDWRTAMLVEGAVVVGVLLPLALIWARSRPADLGQFVDGDPANGRGSRAEWGATRAEAVRQPFFWVLVGVFATAGFFNAAIGFHLIALLGERGLSATEAAANFLPQAIAGTAATLLVGSVIDRASPRLVIAVSMLAFAAAFAWGTVAEPGWSAVGFGVVFGACGNALRAIENGITPQLFGTAHIGAIRGVVSGVTITCSSFAPLLYSLFYAWTGSFSLVLWLSALVPLAVMVGALTAPLPRAHHEAQSRLTT